ncbi:heterogeneous nuclear ribonucleoprotein 1-like [Dioscorea cayenensis subsp. rotundata]|uniref:Heterogeneous nuclear ribonucleoprotein 1-like n=1 Tax=Dioscorea cayennensis subsp. rotundata TaxID=55577 RepID=A0AB40D297_DIOCR|nr:heterogeneous nuclear ribonucleoprotein 1-like [Dioscorea cayenensis subsp. rotundata]
MASKARIKERDGASPGKIFVGGLHRDTTDDIFKKHFSKYGAIDDIVIMKDQRKQPRGFGFVTYVDPSVVDKVIEDTHVICGKQVEIKRTIPRGSQQSKDFKTKKIFVGGIPTQLTEDEFKDFFSKYGKVADHQIMRDHATKRSRGFGFIIFESEQVVDDLLSKGNYIDLAGSKVEIKKAEPKKASNPPPSAYDNEPRPRSFNDGFSGFGDAYGGYGADGFGPASYRAPAGLPPPRFGNYGGYGGGTSEFVDGYGGIGGGMGGGFGGYRGESSLGYSSRFGSYGGGFAGGYGGGALGGYGRGEEGFGGYGGGYDSGPIGGYGSGGIYGSRGAGYGGGAASRYHPYAR